MEFVKTEISKLLMVCGIVVHEWRKKSRVPQSDDIKYLQPTQAVHPIHPIMLFHFLHHNESTTELQMCYTGSEVKWTGIERDVMLNEECFFLSQQRKM